MAIYKFRFQKILELRKSMENQKKYILSIYIKKFMDEKEALERLNDSLESSNDIFNHQVSSGITISKLKNIIEEQNFYKESIRKKADELIIAEENVKKNRYELMKAMQSKKTMQKLNEIHYSEFQYNEQRKIEQQTEEIIFFKESRK